eukprot:12242980-Ditylum_brightwellii.AAC.1
MLMLGHYNSSHHYRFGHWLYFRQLHPTLSLQKIQSRSNKLTFGSATLLYKVSCADAMLVFTGKRHNLSC